MTCRFCKETYFEDQNDEKIVKYSTRHYAHWSCYCANKGAGGLRVLSAWQVKQCPLRILENFGLVELAKTIIKDETRA